MKKSEKLFFYVIILYGDDKYMDIDFIFFNVLYFLIVFLLVFLVDFYVLSSKKENKKRVDKLTSQADFIIRRYNIDITKFSLRRLNFHISIINGFIISFVLKLIWQFNY